eukprot:g2512.t1
MGFFIVLFLFMNLGSSAARCRSNISYEMRAFHLKVSGALQHLLVLASMADLCIQMHVFFINNQCNMGLFLADDCFDEAHFNVIRGSIGLATLFLQTFPYTQKIKFEARGEEFGEKSICGLYDMFEYFFAEWASIFFNIIAIGEVTGANQTLFFWVTVVNLALFVLPLVFANMFEERHEYTSEWYANHMAIVELITDLPVLIITIKDGLYQGNATLSAKLIFDIIMIEKNFFWKFTHTNIELYYPDSPKAELTFWHQLFPPIFYPEAWETEHMGICSVIASNVIMHMTSLGLTVYSSDPEYARLFVIGDTVVIALCMVMLPLLNDKEADQRTTFLVGLFLFIVLEILQVFSCTYLWQLQEPPRWTGSQAVLKYRLLCSLCSLLVASLEYFRKGTGCKDWQSLGKFLTLRADKDERKDMHGEPSFAVTTFVLEWFDMSVIYFLVMDHTIERKVRMIYLLTTCANLLLFILPTILFMRDKQFNVMKSSMHIAVCDLATDVPNLFTTLANKTYKGRIIVIIPIILSIVLIMKNACVNPIFYFGSSEDERRPRGFSLERLRQKKKRAKKQAAVVKRARDSNNPMFAGEWVDVPDDGDDQPLENPMARRWGSWGSFALARRSTSDAVV